jgi:hypothetical protein
MPITNKSGGGPFYKTGPLYTHGDTHDGDPTDPKEKAKAKAKAEANKKASEASRVYGKATTTRTTDDSGITTVTKTIPYTQSGEGTATTKKSYKQLEAEGGDVEAAKKFNASKTNKGVVTRSYKTFKMKSKGIDLTPIMPTASIDIKKLVTPKPKMPSYSFSMKKQSGTTLVDKKLPSKSNLARKTKTKGGSCGCKY